MYPSERNVLCPRYSRCLSRAARTDAKSLPCTGCRHREEKVPPEVLLADLPGVLLLFMAVFSRENRLVRAFWEEHRREAAKQGLSV